MAQSNYKIVHVNVTIALRDYYHAYVDSVRTRLIIACVIVASVIIAFIYFFTLIGELEILWKLSPLFFGLPIIAIGGQFLRMHAAYRKSVRELSDAERQIRYTFTEKGNGFDIVRGKNFSHVDWESVRSVVERRRYFQFVLGKYDAMIIPKRFVRDSSDEKALREILASKLGSRAKLSKA